MSVRQILTRLFTRRPTTVSTRDTVADQLERRQRVRQLHPVSNACRANGLNNREREQVFRHFEVVGATAGLAEARTQAVNLAAQLGRNRRERFGEHLDPWHGPKAA